MRKKPTRRDFLKVLAATLGAGVIGGSHWVRQALLGSAQGKETKLFIPFLKRAEIGVPSPTPSPTPKPTPTSEPQPPPEIEGRVVHVHSPDATFWDGTDHQYWNYVDQDVVDEMVDQGLMSLTNQATIEDAWHVLLPDYQPGQGIAVKVNFNHSNSCDDDDNEIVALIHPVNAIVRGLKQIGVLESDIWIYDAIRSIPNIFIEGCEYPGIIYYDSGCRIVAGFSSSDPNAHVSFSPPPGVPMPPPIKISDVLINATYLVNIPIMRIHSSTGVTLAFKNHFGTINFPSELHDYVCIGWEYYRSDYNPLIDLYMNPHIQGKTILTIGDGLIAAKQWRIPDPSWDTFDGEVPNSLFFSKDPVAIDCVMSDFLSAETSFDDRACDYLLYANSFDLGIYERGDPWGNGYSVIDYLKISL